jgi:hypothetical protein
MIQIILAAYFQLVLWFPLGSWNDQPGKRLVTLVAEGEALAVLGFALAMLLPVLLFALGLWKRWLGLIWLGLIGYGAWALDTLLPTRCTSFWTCFSSRLS